MQVLKEEGGGREEKERGPVLMKKLDLSLFNRQTLLQSSNLVNFPSTLF